VAEALGQAVLLTGDLALLHDSHGWLWRQQLHGRLTVILINNDGGGIFEQLPIRTTPAQALDFERLFAMPQPVDALELAAVHGVPGRRVESASDWELQLAWALQQPLASLRIMAAAAGAQQGGFAAVAGVWGQMLLQGQYHPAVPGCGARQLPQQPAGCHQGGKHAKA
jgi:2-succinyl-5-enolpyruvyl-6-hydroxy-3-cyclohexene-1-carboxylate synthase